MASVAMLCGQSTIVMAATAPAETDLSGQLASDQSATTGSEIVTPMITPQATSVNGQPLGTLTTDVMASDEVDAPYDLQVFTSTGSGTSALTGVATDDATGSIIPGASVTLQPSAGGSASTVTTDANGGFAFANIPAARQVLPTTSA
jgi:Carboxypeptidase regulatory-like domain